MFKKNKRKYTSDNFFKHVKRVFDFSFKSFITVQVLRLIYWIDVVLGVALVVFTIVAGFNESVVLGVLALIVAPLLLLFYLVVLRVVLEVVAVVFSIADHVKKIAEGLDNIVERGAKTVDKFTVEEDD